MISLPEWCIVHVPHDSTYIPGEVRNQFVLNDNELAHELLRMTDHHTHRLFAEGVPAEQVVRSSVSRLVVDVERFASDNEEPMAKRGMGAVYMVTHAGAPLRALLSAEQRQQLMDRWYWPHHERLTAVVDNALGRFDRAVILDVHSFPATALPYELDQSQNRPQICIGTDSFHTPPSLVEELVRCFKNAGLTTNINTPFSGALVPLRHYRKDSRVSAVMIEVRRDIYMDESTGAVLANFMGIAETLRECTALAVASDQPTASDHLKRFVRAQEHDYKTALAELYSGRKRTHWIWYVFPQLRELGRSEMAREYGIADRQEAAAYIAHPLLGARLVECVKAVLGHSGLGADEILGEVDAMKFRSCLTLFAEVAPTEPAFFAALEAFYQGRPDNETLRLLG